MTLEEACRLLAKSIEHMEKRQEKGMAGSIRSLIKYAREVTIKNKQLRNELYTKRSDDE